MTELPPVVIPTEDRRTSAPSMPPTTTFQEDVTKAGQRKVNLIWEYTQAIIALLVIVANVIVAVAQSLMQMPNKEYPDVLSNTLFLVVGFYFSRTNHTAIGGVGSKENQGQEYQGR